MKMIKNIVFLYFPVILFQCSFVCTHVYKRSRERSAYIVWNELDGYNIVGGTTQEDFVARGFFKNHINDTGWSFLEVETDPSVPDDIQAYAAGILEGYLTYDLIHMHWVNVMKDFCDEDRKEICKKIESYVEKNLNWITNTVRAYGDDDPYWHQVKLFYEQLNGLVVGVQNGTAGDVDPLGFKELLWMNIAGDLDDLVPALNASEEPLFLHGQRTVGSGSCSALIKLLPGNEDLYVAHDTWSSYQSMLRILKRYSLKYHLTSNSSKVVPGHTMTFSSYPGTIQSGDDFYLISSGLTTVETTIGNSNNSLWKYINPLGQVPEGVRTMVANRLAENGRAWSKIFSQYNSGTYNNQWMVVDYKLFKPQRPELKDNLLWVLEQIPGVVHASDKTDVLREQSYWPSYNIPFYPDIFQLSGVPPMVQKYGDFFSYDKSPRALIFKRDHVKVTDTESMIKLMRYNNFKVDPLSKCNCTPPYSAENAISARNDLNPKNGTYPFGALGHRSHGGTDMKMTDSNMFLNLQFVAISGPTWDDLPPFEWSKTDFGITTPHVGHPDKWAFKPVQTKWSFT